MIFRKKVTSKNIIFIIGTGRSGTHLLARTIGNNEEIDAFIEDERFFNEVTNLAIQPIKHLKKIKRILKKYNEVFSKSTCNFILEKTHPNIWFVEEILDFFPNAKFIGIRRNPYATISSMLNHDGVLSWYDKIPLNEENHFLGVTEKNKSTFESLPLESKCAYRWLSHSKRLDHLESNFKDKVLVVDYEEFYESYQHLIEKIEKFLKLTSSLKSEPLNKRGKDKWQEMLSKEQIDNISQVIGV